MHFPTFYQQLSAWLDTRTMSDACSSQPCTHGCFLVVMTAAFVSGIGKAGQNRSQTTSKLSNFSPSGVYYPPSTGTPIGSPASPSTPPYHFSSLHHLIALRVSGTIPGSDRKLPLLICFEVTCFFQSRAQNFLHNITSHSC